MTQTDISCKLQFKIFYFNRLTSCKQIFDWYMTCFYNCELCLISQIVWRNFILYLIDPHQFMPSSLDTLWPIYLFYTKNLVDVWIIIELLSIFLLCNLHFLVSVIVEVNYFIYVFYTYQHIWLNFNFSSCVPFKCFVNTLKGYTWMT